MQNKANTPTHKKPALPFSNPINILFKKGLADIPSESTTTINNNLMIFFLNTYATTK